MPAPASGGVPPAPPVALPALPPLELPALPPVALPALPPVALPALPPVALPALPPVALPALPPLDAPPLPLESSSLLHALANASIAKEPKIKLLFMPSASKFCTQLSAPDPCGATPHQQMI